MIKRNWRAHVISTGFMRGLRFTLHASVLGFCAYYECAALLGIACILPPSPLSRQTALRALRKLPPGLGRLHPSLPQPRALKLHVRSVHVHRY